MFLHGYDVHDPYHKPEPYENFFDPNYRGFVDKLTLITSHNKSDLPRIKEYGNKFVYVNDSENITLNQTDINHIIAHYDGNILYADSLLGKFFADLDNLGILNKTIIVIFGDHGETLADRVLEDNRAFGHSAPYDEIIHVPLIIWHPELGHKIIENQAQLIDIMPTLLDFLKISKPKDLQGRSLLPLIENGTDVNPYAFTEGFVGVKAIRTMKWKLINQGDRLELYDLDNDKREQTNVINNFPDVKKDLETKILLRFLR